MTALSYKLGVMTAFFQDDGILPTVRNEPNNNESEIEIIYVKFECQGYITVKVRGHNTKMFRFD